MILKKFLLQIKFAGLQAFLKRIKPKEENCTSYRSEVKLLMTDDILREPGGLVKFTIPYCDSEGQYLGVVTEQDDEYDASHRVYNRKYPSAIKKLWLLLQV